MNKFAEWMRNNHKVQRGVAGELSISTSTLHDILRKGLIPSLKLAYEIEKYTRGDITLYDWVDQDINKISKVNKSASKIISKNIKT